MTTIKRRRRQTYTRREGACFKPDVLDAYMAARGIGTRDLARLTGLHLDTITQARKGQRLRKASMMKIVAILDKLPVNPTMGALVGLASAPVEKKRKVA